MELPNIQNSYLLLLLAGWGCWDAEVIDVDCPAFGMHLWQMWAPCLNLPHLRHLCSYLQALPIIQSPLLYLWLTYLLFSPSLQIWAVVSLMVPVVIKINPIFKADWPCMLKDYCPAPVWKGTEMTPEFSIILIDILPCKSHGCHTNNMIVLH